MKDGTVIKRDTSRIRLTLRMPETLDVFVRKEAEIQEMPLNQFVVTVLSRWVKSHRFPSRTP